VTVGREVAAPGFTRTCADKSEKQLQVLGPNINIGDVLTNSSLTLKFRCKSVLEDSALVAVFANSLVKAS
jgi:hypothetical protein